MGPNPKPKHSFRQKIAHRTVVSVHTHRHKVAHLLEAKGWMAWIGLQKEEASVGERLN